MKKTFAFALVLLLLSAVIISVLSAYVTGQEEAVTIEEHTIYGDKSAADGLVFATSVEIEDQLFWDVNYSIGDNKISKLDYQYYDSPQQSPSREDESRVSLQMDEIEIGMGAGGSNLSLEYSSAYVRAVASRTPDGEYHEEIITISDYYKYFPIRFDYYNVRSRETKQYPAMEYIDNMPHVNAYFKIPVPEELQVKVSVQKSDYGAVTEYQTDYVEGNYKWYPYIDTYTANGDHCAYFVFTLGFEDLDYADYSQIEGGYGIYKIPFYPEEKAETIPVGSDIEMVYPIDTSTQRVMGLTANDAGDKMLLVTLEEDGYYLTVLDMEDASQLQKIHLLNVEQEREDGFKALYLTCDDDLYLYRNSEGSFAFVMQDTDEEYTVVMRGEIDSLQEKANFYWKNIDRAGIEYNNGRLVLATTIDYYGVDTAVAVFENGELVYVGVYDYSGMTGRSLERRDYHHWMYTPVEVWFE